MTNDADFKRVVRDRMAATGESYTRALSAVTANTVARIDKLLTQAREHGGDRLDREPMLIEAANLI